MSDTCVHEIATNECNLCKNIAMNILNVQTNSYLDAHSHFALTNQSRCQYNWYYFTFFSLILIKVKSLQQQAIFILSRSGAHSSSKEHFILFPVLPSNCRDIVRSVMDISLPCTRIHQSPHRLCLTEHVLIIFCRWMKHCFQHRCLNWTEFPNVATLMLK